MEWQQDEHGDSVAGNFRIADDEEQEAYMIIHDRHFVRWEVSLHAAKRWCEAEMRRAEGRYSDGPQSKQ